MRRDSAVPTAGQAKAQPSVTLRRASSGKCDSTSESREIRLVVDMRGLPFGWMGLARPRSDGWEEPEVEAPAGVACGGTPLPVVRRSRWGLLDVDRKHDDVRGSTPGVCCCRAPCQRSHP